MDTALLSDPRVVALHDALGLIIGDRPAAVSPELVDTVTAWDQVVLSLPLFESLSPEEAVYALVGVERLRRRVDAAVVVLSQSLRAGRDTVAALSRATNMSNREAKQYVRVARQRDVVPEIVEELANGGLSLEHASALASTDADTARSLIPHATNERVDEFRVRVRKADVDKAGGNRRARQVAERSVRFGATDEGSLRATIVLPETEGVEFRNTLEHLCDAAYRQQYPERASALGGHQVPPKDQRLADALVAWMRGQQSGSGRPAVVVVVDGESLECTRLPNDPIDRAEAAGLLGRAQLCALIRDRTTHETIQFGRNRRLASPLQKLLLAVRFGYCAIDGCYEPALGADSDHIIPFARGGLTDDAAMQPLCHRHHPEKTETEQHGHDAHNRNGEHNKHGEHNRHGPPGAHAPPRRGRARR
jgi:hypothetical protein